MKKITDYQMRLNSCFALIKNRGEIMHSKTLQSQQKSFLNWDISLRKSSVKQKDKRENKRYIDWFMQLQ
jgi:hypothetical protein